MFSNTLHGYPQISTFSLKTEVDTPLGKHPLSLKNQRYAMLLHINNVEYIFVKRVNCINTIVSQSRFRQTQNSTEVCTHLKV